MLEFSYRLKILGVHPCYRAVPGLQFYTEATRIRRQSSSSGFGMSEAPDCVYLLFSRSLHRIIFSAFLREKFHLQLYHHRFGHCTSPSFALYAITASFSTGYQFSNAVWDLVCLSSEYVAHLNIYPDGIDGKM